MLACYRPAWPASPLLIPPSAMRTLATLGLALAALWGTAAAAQTYPSTGGPFAIPDGAGSNTPGPPLTNTITVPSGPTIADVDIMVNVAHSWVGDLQVRVVHGAGTSSLIDRPQLNNPNPGGCGGANFNIVVDDEGTTTTDAGCSGSTPAYPANGHFRPTTPLSVFDGQSAAGTWTMTVIDNWNADTGTLNSWAVVVTPTNTAAEPGADRQGNTLAIAGENPAHHRAQFALTVAEAQHVRVVVYDALGRAVRTALDAPVNGGATAYMDVNVADLAAGRYVLLAVGERFSLSRTFSVR